MNHHIPEETKTKINQLLNGDLKSLKKREIDDLEKTIINDEYIEEEFKYN